MVWKKIPKKEVSQKDIQKGAIYGLYIIVGLVVLAWLTQHFTYIG